MKHGTLKFIVIAVVLTATLFVADDAEARRRRRNRGNLTNFLRALQQAQLLNALFANQGGLNTGLGIFGNGFLHGGGYGGGFGLRPMATTTPTQAPGQGDGVGTECDQTKALNLLNGVKGSCTTCHAGIDFAIENSKLVIKNGPKGNSDLAKFITAVGSVGVMKGFDNSVVSQLTPNGCRR